jgi:hypothetical protein
MGYDICGDGDVHLPLDKVKDAIKAIKKAHKEKHKGTKLPVFTTAEELADKFEDIAHCFRGTLDDGYIIIECRESFRHLSECEWVFEVIAEFVEGGPFEFRGEDGLQWRWAFEGGKFVTVDSEVVWGRDAKAPHIAGEIEDMIYDSATGKIKVHADPQLILDQIEELLRKNGFGPFAGMETLDILAKAGE